MRNMLQHFFPLGAGFVFGSKYDKMYIIQGKHLHLVFSAWFHVHRCTSVSFGRSPFTAEQHSLWRLYTVAVCWVLLFVSQITREVWLCFYLKCEWRDWSLLRHWPAESVRTHDLWLCLFKQHGWLSKHDSHFNLKVWSFCDLHRPHACTINKNH